MRLLLSCALLLFASRGANAACVLSGARPTAALPTMAAGQEFAFLATPDCATVRFTIQDTTVSKIPSLVGPVGMGRRAYTVALTESEWDAVVAASGTTLTWIVTGRTSTGVMTRLVTTNDLNVDEPITFDLAMADAQLNGWGYPTSAGSTVADAGDVDGDGRDDFLVGAWGSDEGGFYRSGAAYLILGPVTGTHDLSVAADATIIGNDDYDGAGRSVSGAGDMDGDGHADLLIGAPSAGNGVVCLFLGPVTGTLDVSMADATLVSGEFADALGNGGVGQGGASGAGDVDGDGHDDLLLAAYFNTSAGYDAGAVYLALGPVTGTRDLSLADSKLVGEAIGDQAGVSVSGAGDVDADGHDDLLVGAWRNDAGGTDAGAAYLLLGPVTGDDDLSVADAKLVGEDMDDSAGISVSGAGDVNGDGRDDLLIGANGDDQGGRNVGAAYLVLGPATGTLDLSMADAKLVGEETYDNAGRSVSGAGDMDGDGHDDLLVGALNDEGGKDAGAAYLVIGPVTGTHDLSSADVKFVGKRQTEEADIVSGAGDVDGDGRDDLLIGAPNNGEGGSSAGAVYLVSGGGL